MFQQLLGGLKNHNSTCCQQLLDVPPTSTPQSRLSCPAAAPDGPAPASRTRRPRPSSCPRSDALVPESRTRHARARALEILLEGIHESSFLRFFRIDPQFGQNRAKPQPRATAHTTKTTFSTVAGPRARTTYHICSNSCWKVSQLPTKTVAGVPNHISGFS